MSLKFAFESLIKEEMLKKFNIDLSDKNVNATFSLYSIEPDTCNKLFDKIYKGVINIDKEDHLYSKWFNFLIYASTNISSQSICTIEEN